jgi:hypothetical protein
MQVGCQQRDTDFIAGVRGGSCFAAKGALDNVMLSVDLP